MVVYRYNLKKYLRTPSTLILMILTLILVAVMTYFICHSPNININDRFNNKINKYQSVLLESFVATGSLIFVMVIIFAAFKSVQLFRDEINEGSLLLVISKPVSRRRILQQKWMALLTIFFIFIVPAVLLHMSMTYGLIPNNDFKKEIFLGFFSEIFTAFIVFLLFSSLFLMISLKLGVKTVIGISFGFVVSLLISQTVQAGTYNPIYLEANLDTINRGVVSNDYSLTKNTSLKQSDTKLTEVPKLYWNSTRKNRFKKIWPITLGYHTGQINTLILGDKWRKLADKSAVYAIPMKPVSCTHFDFTYINNNFYISKNSNNISENLISYLNKNSDTWKQNKTNIISDIKKFDELAISQAPSKENHKALISIISFNKLINSSINNQFNKNDVDNLYKINSQLSDWYTNHGFNKTVQPDREYITMNHNLNALFGVLSSYYFTNKFFQSMGLKYLDFNNGMYRLNDWDIDEGTSFFSDDIDNPGSKKSHNISYNSWSNYQNYCSNIVRQYVSESNNGWELGDKIAKEVQTYGFQALNKYFYTVQWVNFANPYAILAVYIGIIGVITPLTYYMFRKSDFS